MSPHFLFKDDMEISQSDRITQVKHFTDNLNICFLPFQNNSNIRICLSDRMSEQTCIYRYSSFSNLMLMLEGKFRLSRRKLFSDHREAGEYASDFIKVLYKDTLDKRRSRCHQRNKSLLELTSLFYASCWTLNEREVYPLWKAYTSNEYGVLIKSSIEELLSSIQLEPGQTLYCSPMHYEEEKNKSDIYDMLFHKTPEYEIENELRLYIISENLLKDNIESTILKINPETAINDIILSPFLSSAEAESFGNLLRKSYEFLRFKISYSEILEY